MSRLSTVAARLRDLLSALVGRDGGRAICPVDDWAFTPRDTDGVCPLCGWRPPGALARSSPLARIDPFVVGLLVLLAASVAMGVVVVLAYQRS